MVLEINGDSPEVSLERLPSENGERASPNVPIKYRRPNVFVFRDFPVGCGPRGGFVPEVLEDSVQSEISLHEKEGLTTVEAGGIRLPKAFDNSELVNLSNTTEHKTTELPKKAVVVESLLKFNPPRRRTSAIRCFPPGCGISASQVSKEDCLKAIDAFRANSFGHICRCAEHTMFKEVASSDANEDGVTGTSKSNLYQSSQTVPKNYNQDSECLDDEMDKEPMIFKKNSMNQLQVEVPVGSELPVQRVVVQALMAAPNCPWKQGRRAIKSKLTVVQPKAKERSINLLD